MAEIPESAHKMFEGKNFAHVATLMADGSPQVTPVWVDHEDGTVKLNTTKGRLKARNMERDGRVALSVTDEQNPYESVAIQGQVTEVTEDGAEDHINALAKRYLNEDVYPFSQPGEVRLIVRIRPDKVMHYGA